MMTLVLEELSCDFIFWKENISEGQLSSQGITLAMMLKLYYLQNGECLPYYFLMKQGKSMHLANAKMV